PRPHLDRLLDPSPHGPRADNLTGGWRSWLRGAGFIGSHIARARIRMGMQVRILAGPRGESRGIDSVTEVCVYADITDSARLESLFAGAGTVVHAAGPPSVKDSFDRAVEYMRVHAVGTGTVLETCRTTGVNRIVYISSAEVYG